MTRTQLGERLCQWHSSMHDPVYAVGSFYVSNQRYPKKDIVDDCMSSLEKQVDEYKRMLKGEVVSVVRQGVTVSLKKFAGYTNKEMRKLVKDLEEIISSLKQFVMEDYINE